MVVLLHLKRLATDARFEVFMAMKASPWLATWLYGPCSGYWDCLLLLVTQTMRCNFKCKLQFTVKILLLKTELPCSHFSSLLPLFFTHLPPVFSLLKHFMKSLLVCFPQWQTAILIAVLD